MSISISWPNITSPPHGPELAEQIRAFIHARFQTAQLPRFIRSVAVQGFELGSVPPELEIKDLGDPLPDFYESDEEEEEDDDDDDDGEADQEGEGGEGSLRNAPEAVKPSILDALPAPFQLPLPLVSPAGAAPQHHPLAHPLPSPLSVGLGVPGGTSNLGYFHQPLGSLSGTQTPLAAVASGSSLGPNRWAEWASAASTATTRSVDRDRDRDDDEAMSPLRPGTATSAATAASQPGSASSARFEQSSPTTKDPCPPPRAMPAPTDLQIITHVKYSGDMRLTLTAEILLDYPMPSFASIPVTLAVTGVVFDGVAVLAWCRGKLCFCFLGEAERKVVLEGEEEGSGGGGGGGVLREVRVESEIGERGGGKTVLKNVGKVGEVCARESQGDDRGGAGLSSFWTFLI